MKESSLVLPTAVRLREDTAESGGWSRFFDEVLASIEEDAAPRRRGEANASTSSGDELAAWSVIAVRAE